MFYLIDSRDSYNFYVIRIKDKIDNPPEKKDHQKISNSLANFIKLKDEAKAGTYKRKRAHQNDDEDKPGTAHYLEMVQHIYIESLKYNSRKLSQQIKQQPTTSKQ